MQYKINTPNGDFRISVRNEDTAEAIAQRVAEMAGMNMGDWFELVCKGEALPGDTKMGSVSIYAPLELLATGRAV